MSVFEQAPSSGVTEEKGSTHMKELREATLKLMLKCAGGGGDGNMYTSPHGFLHSDSICAPSVRVDCTLYANGRLGLHSVNLDVTPIRKRQLFTYCLAPSRSSV